MRGVIRSAISACTSANSASAMIRPTATSIRLPPVTKSLKPLSIATLLPCLLLSNLEEVRRAVFALHLREKTAAGGEGALATRCAVDAEVPHSRAASPEPLAQPAPRPTPPYRDSVPLAFREPAEG